MKNGIIIFFYVDDIALAFRKRQEQEALELIRGLQARYSLTGGSNLQWFLGIEVLRDREKNLIWLSQSAYIDKIANLAQSKQSSRYPMGKEELLPYDGITERASCKAYLRKIGSLLYTAVITRPDVTFAVS